MPRVSRRILTAFDCMIATIALASASEGPEWDAISRRADRVRTTPEETRWMQIPWVRSVVDGQRMARA